MSKICPNCKSTNPNKADFCQNCGADFKNVLPTTQSSGTSEWWNKQGTGTKAAIGIAGICCIGLILIVAFAGMFSSDKTTSTSTDTNTSTSHSTITEKETPVDATISQLYSNGISEGTIVKVSGTVLQSDGYNLRIENSDGQDILIQGIGLDAYEDQSVTAIGTFIGPTSYTTTLGSSRTVPTIDDAKFA